MEKVIGQLHKMDEKAHRIIKRAQDEKALLNDEHEKIMKELEQDTSEETSLKLKKLQLQADENFTKEIMQLKAENEKLLKELEEINEKKHDHLVNQVFEHILRSE